MGYSEIDAADLYANLARINSKISYRVIRDVQNIRSALYENNWHILICNHNAHSFNFHNALEILKQCGHDIPFLIYSDDMNDEQIISSIQAGAHDYIQKGHITQLMLAIERELKNVEVRRSKLQAESKAYRLAYYDDLTGFPKRNLFCKKVTEILFRQHDEQKLAAVYFIKIGRLPFINNTYGYHIGDRLIQQLSYRLSVYTNRKSLLSRLEGNKFAFFNFDIYNLEDIQKFADRIMRMSSTPIIINNLEFYVTLNIGVSVYPSHGNDISMLLANAEKPLSDFQDIGRNQCRYFINEVSENSGKHIKLEESLKNAVANNELILRYQPIIDLQSGSIKGAEALVRWNHPTLGRLSPEKFIMLAKETGQIIEIGKWILKQSCLQAKLWHEMGHDSLFISVNIASIELDQSQFIRYVTDILSETGISTNLLELEVTESFLQDTETNIKKFHELSRMGVKFSIDDYGAGNSSLGYLKKLPINNLKIDRLLTMNLHPDSDSAAIVSAIIAMAKSLGLRVQAKGIETSEQYDFLLKNQCDYAQGYFFGKPISAENFLRLLDQPRTGTLSYLVSRKRHIRELL